MPRKKEVINPQTGEKLKKEINVLIYGLTENQTDIIINNLPNNNLSVIDCTECFTDIIALSYVAVFMNPKILTSDNIQYFNWLADEIGFIGCSEKIIFTEPHPILNELKANVKHIVLQNEFDFIDKIKFVLLEACRAEKRSKAYSDTISQMIRVLSEIRKHPYISTTELAEIIERNPRTVQRCITTLICAGEFIEYDRKKKGWFIYENKSVLWGDY